MVSFFHKMCSHGQMCSARTLAHLLWREILKESREKERKRDADTQKNEIALKRIYNENL